MKVVVKVLDEMLWPTHKLPFAERKAPPLIALMKIDVQGYEQRVLHGVRALLECGAIKIVQWEVEMHFLGKQQAHPTHICQYMQKLNYVVAFMSGKVVEDCESECQNLPNQDMWARLISPVNESCWPTPGI